MVEIANLNTKLSLESASFLSGVEKSRGALRSLIASLDPVAAATAKYNRQVELLENGLKRGKLSVEEHGLALQRLNQRYNEQVRGQTSVTGSTGQMRAGMQQLSFQIGDVATQFASGTRPMVIFAQQGSQVIQAIQLMTNGSKGFLGFLAGPWGQIITAAVVVLSSLSAKLFDSADAANAAADGADTYTDALKRLQDQAGSFSFGSDEFSKVNKQLLEAEGRVARLQQEAKTAFSGPTYMMGPDGIPVRVAPRGQTDVQRELDAAISDRDEARSVMAGLMMQRRNREIADRRTERPKRGPVDRSDQREERFDDQLARLKEEQAQLQLGLTADLRHRAQIQHDQVAAELEAYRVDLDHQVAQKRITAEKAKELLAAKEHNAMLQDTAINWKLDDDLAKEQVDLAQSRLDLAGALKQGELDGARTQADRRRIQLEMLAAETEQLKFAVQQQLLSKDLTESERQRLQNKLAQIDAEAGNKRASIERGTMGPLAQYLDSLPRSALELNEAYERVAAEGLQAVNDGLADAITGAKSLGDVFRNVANQIIGDLARIAIQKSITAPLANALFGGGGLDLGGLTSTIASNNAALTSGLAHMATGGSIRIGGRPGIDRNLLSINGYPVANVSQGETVSVRPSNDNGGGGLTIIQNFSPNYAGNAATREDLVHMAALTRAETIRAVQDVSRRRA